MAEIQQKRILRVVQTSLFIHPHLRSRHAKKVRNASDLQSITVYHVSGRTERPTLDMQ